MTTEIYEKKDIEKFERKEDLIKKNDDLRVEIPEKEPVFTKPFKEKPYKSSAKSVKGLILGLIIILTVVFAGVANPVIAVGMAVLGFGVMIAIGVIPLTAMGITLVAITGVIFIVILRS